MGGYPFHIYNSILQSEFQVPEYKNYKYFIKIDAAGRWGVNVQITIFQKFYYLLVCLLSL